jgi:hypothetical protein
MLKVDSNFTSLPARITEGESVSKQISGENIWSQTRENKRKMENIKDLKCFTISPKILLS